MVEEFKITEEAFTEYTNKLREIAIENNFTIGWERPNSRNPFNYSIFVKDFHNNTWGYDVSTNTLDLNAIFKVWQEIENLMLRIIDAKSKNQHLIT